MPVNLVQNCKKMQKLEPKKCILWSKKPPLGRNNIVNSKYSL